MRSSKRIILFFLVGIFSLFAVVYINQSESKASEKKSLFRISESPKALSDKEKNSPASVREAKIEMSLNRNALSAERELEIQVFDGKTFLAKRLESEGLVDNGNSTTWRGKIGQAKVGGDVVITYGETAVNGLIYTPDGVFELTTIRGETRLIELDQSEFPDCKGGVTPPAEDKTRRIESLGSGSDSGDRVDVLVVYTEAVKNTVGGDTQAQNLAQSAIDITNTAYMNSKIRQRVRLVHSEQTALTEANSLSQLRSDSATQTLRSTHNADMVAMLVDTLGGCGIAYVMTNVSTGFQGSAYSITRRSCAVGNLTFAHELGHNMGSTHDPANGGSAAYSYSYGHYVSGSYRTVLSYSNQCSGGCTRVPQFSSPSIVYNGVASGILGERNNARSIRNTADTVANFRYSGSSIELTNFSDEGSFPVNVSRTLNWTSDNVGGNVKIEVSKDAGTTWQTVVASTPNDGSEAINLSGPQTKQVRLRVSSVNDPNVSDSSVKNLSID